MTINSDQHIEKTDKKVKRTRLRIRLPSMGLKVSERRILLWVVDVFLISIALILSLFIQTDVPIDTGLLNAWKWFLTLIVTWYIFASIFDIYDLAKSASAYHSIRASGTVAVLTSLVYLAIPWLTPFIQNRSQGFLFVGISVVLIITWRFVYAQIFTQPTFQTKALILGTGAAGRKLVESLRSDFAQKDPNPYRGTGHVIMGYIELKVKDTPERNIGSLPVLGTGDELLDLVKEFEIDEVILTESIDQLEDIKVKEAILDCFELGIPLTGITAIFERLTGRLPVDYVGWDLQAVTQFDDKATRRVYMALKRLTDILICIPGIVLLGIMIPFVYFGNLFTSRGPVFYSQDRLGVGGKSFSIIKFRTMIPDAESQSGVTWAAINDDRVTFVGRWLRKLHLDEVPQCINVLRGEMSIVGPRPERGEFVRNLSKTIPFYRARHFVRPGITGWAQIHQDYGGSIDDSKIKLEYDLYYIKKVGFWLDTMILLRTFTKVLGFKGR